MSGKNFETLEVGGWYQPQDMNYIAHVKSQEDDDKFMVTHIHKQYGHSYPFWHSKDGKLKHGGCYSDNETLLYRVANAQGDPWQPEQPPQVEEAPKAEQAPKAEEVRVNRTTEIACSVGIVGAIYDSSDSDVVSLNVGSMSHNLDRHELPSIIAVLTRLRDELRGEA